MVLIVMVIHDRKTEKFVAVASFFVAAVLAFIGQHLAEQGDIKSGTIIMCAQFLTLCATIFGIDYKLHDNGQSNARNPK